MQSIVTKYINKFLSPIIYLTFITLVISFGYYSFIKEKEHIYTEVDAKMQSVAQLIPMLLPKDFHDRTTSADSISSEEFRSNMLRLNEIAKIFNVDYLYTSVRKDGVIRITSSNATEDQMKTGVNLAHYFGPYYEATDEMVNMYDDNKTRFFESSDRWGTFRSIIIPMQSPQGHTYISGVSMSLYGIHKHLKDRTVTDFLFGLGLVLLSLPIFLWRHRRMSNLAYYDALTGLPNRISFGGIITTLINMSKRNNKPLALMFLDLDGFKNVNDTMGHSVGDKLLVQVTQRLQSVLRKGDVPSRQGGDEFIIALPDTGLEGAKSVSKKILEAVAQPYTVDGHALSVTFSIGIAVYPHDGDDFESLSIKADISMYEAKKLGGNCFKSAS